MRKANSGNAAWTVLMIVLAVILAGWIGEAQTDQSKPSPARPARHVVMISIDGLMPEYYTAPAQIGLKVPNLVEMKLGGAYADGVEGVYPSVTYPSHTTLATGVRPATHGIVQNRIFEAPTEPQTREWYWFASALKSDTLWSVAKKAGLVTAAVGWPVTVGAEIDYNIPEIFDPREDPPTPARSLQHTTPSLLPKLAGLSFGSDTSTDGRRTTATEFIIEEYKPDLMLIHLVDLDSIHHRYGPRSPQAIQTAEREDGYLGRIIQATRRAGIFDNTTFFVVSDHGFAAVSKRFSPGVVLVKEKLITLDSSGKPSDWKAAAWPAGGACAIMLRDPNDKATAARVNEVFSRIASSNSSPLLRVLTPVELQKLGAIPQAALMLEAAPGVAFADALTGPELRDSRDYRGTHGQLPSRPELRSALIVFGEAARPGVRVGLARMIDIAPTAAGLLGLSLPKAEGSPIYEMVKPGLIPPFRPSEKRTETKKAW